MTQVQWSVWNVWLGQKILWAWDYADGRHVTHPTAIDGKKKKNPIFLERERKQRKEHPSDRPRGV